MLQPHAHMLHGFNITAMTNFELCCTCMFRAMAQNSLSYSKFCCTLPSSQCC